MMFSISSRGRTTVDWNRKLLITTILVFTVLLAAPALSAQNETADELFAHAKAEATQEHKNILLVFSASWCGPCKLYERFLEDPQMKPLTEKAFVILRIDVGERKGDHKHANTPDGVKLRSALGTIQEPGFPFLIITDENGIPIVNSYRNGDPHLNVGYPAVPAEIDWYLEMLKRAAPSLTPSDLTATRDWLQAHSMH
jgi:thioredoxin-related protein